MCAFDARNFSEHRRECTSVVPPQDNNERGVARGKCPDRTFGNRFPPLASVRRCESCAHREYPIQQHDASVGPRGQVTVLRRHDAKVVVQFSVNVLQASRERAHVGSGRKREPDGVPRGRVRILPDDEHTNLSEGPLKCRENAVCSGQNAFARGSFSLKKLVDASELPLFWCKHFGPVGGNEPSRSELWECHDFGTRRPRWV